MAVLPPAKVPPRGGTAIAAAASGGVRWRGTMMDWPGVSVAFSASELLCASDHSGTRLAAAMLSMVSPRRTGRRTPLSHNSTSVSPRHEIAQRHRIGLGLRRLDPRQLRHHLDDLSVDVVRLLDVDVRDAAVLLQIVARIMATKARHRHHVAAAEHAVGEEDVDEALDIERHVVGRMRGVDGDDEADRDVLLGRHLGDDDRAQAAHGVADQHDRRRALLVAGDGAIADPSADGEFVDVGREAGLRQLLAEPVHAGREDRPHGAAEQVDLRRRQRLGRRAEVAARQPGPQPASAWPARLRPYRGSRRAAQKLPTPQVALDQSSSPAVPPREADASPAGLVTTDWVDFGARNRDRALLRRAILLFSDGPFNAQPNEAAVDHEVDGGTMKSAVAGDGRQFLVGAVAAAERAARGAPGSATGPTGPRERAIAASISAMTRRWIASFLSIVMWPTPATAHVDIVELAAEAGCGAAPAHPDHRRYRC